MKYLLNIAVFVFILFSAASNAAVVQFQFSGIVNGLDTGLTSEFSVGDTVVGSYKADDTSFVATDLIVTIGGNYTLTANTGYVHIVPGVWFNVVFDSLSGITGGAVNGQAPKYFDIQLDDPNNILAAGVLPLTYSISSFGWDRSNINFPDDLNRLDFAVQSITAVPVPAAAWLFASGLFGLAGTFLRKTAV